MEGEGPFGDEDGSGGEGLGEGESEGGVGEPGEVGPADMGPSWAGDGGEADRLSAEVDPGPGGVGSGESQGIETIDGDRALGGGHRFETQGDLFAEAEEVPEVKPHMSGPQAGEGAEGVDVPGPVEVGSRLAPA